MMTKHPKLAMDECQPLDTNDMLKWLTDQDYHTTPAVTLYTMETPIYLESNKTMREWNKCKEPFLPWQGFAYLLNHELQPHPAHPSASPLLIPWVSS
jgi:hypothetical protein